MQHQEEILTILAEECAEVIQACSKIIRFGNDFTQLEKEIADVLTLVDLLIKFEYVDESQFSSHIDHKMKKLRMYSELFQ